MTYELLLFLQDLRLSAPDFITGIMLFISSPLVYVALPFAFASFFLWCADRKKGEWILMNLATGMFISHFLKDVFRNPRPWVADERIEPEERALKGAGGYSTPSGHSVNAVTGFGSVLMLVRNRSAAIGLTILMLMIMFSRLFLGVHSLFDVIVSVILAAILMAVNWILVCKASEGMNDQVTVIYALMFIIPILIWLMMPSDHPDILKYGGFMIGSIIGRHIGRGYIDYRPADSFSRMAGCLLVGWSMTGIMFLIPYLIGHDVGYFVGGFLSSLCIFVLAPIVMKKIGLLS